MNLSSVQNSSPVKNSSPVQNLPMVSPIISSVDTIKYYLFTIANINAIITCVDTAENRIESTHIVAMAKFLGGVAAQNHIADGLIFIDIPGFTPDPGISREFEALLAARINANGH